VKILFLDQSGQSGGAELCLLDIAKPYQKQCLIGLFEDGPFRSLLEANQIPVQVFSRKPIQVRKDSSWRTGLSSLSQIIPLVTEVVETSRHYDLIYANTPKALVVGALASFVSRCPLVYHLHDILSSEHFSPANLRLAVALANRSTLVIANSQASRSAFIAAGGRPDLTAVVYNGFQPENYQVENHSISAELGLEDRFIVGHFSRLSPWKGQHILLEALTHCPDVAAVFVGDALFGEQAYVEQLHRQVEELGLGDRVRFLGFCSEVVPLMQACHLITHTSTAAEPFGRVIVEAMLCGKPTIAAKAGGALELVDHGINGWLVPAGDATQLAEMIHQIRQDWQGAIAIAHQAQIQVGARFHIDQINQQIHQLLTRVISDRCPLKQVV
jgi:glycosyltransferase involved in cell wall biosynthesis